MYCSKSCCRDAHAAVSEFNHGNHDLARRLICRSLELRGRKADRRRGTEVDHANRVIGYLQAMHALTIARRAILLAKTGRLMPQAT